MRNLFVSEKRCISNLFEMKWKGHFHSPPSVLSETIATPPKPRIKPWFNCDFILDFIDWRAHTSERSASVCSVLPNALGAELFLIVDKSTLLPTALELNGGGAFSMKYYASYIDIVEAAIQDALAGLESQNVSLLTRVSSHITRFRKAAFARLLVVGSDVTFLYCPTLTKLVMRGQRYNLVQVDDVEIDCYVNGADIACFDGWIRWEVARSEQLLVSLPEQSR